MVQKHYDPRRRVLERDRRSRRVCRRRSVGSSSKIGWRLEERRKSITVKGEDLHSRFGHTLRRNCHQTPRLWTSRTPRLYQNVWTNYKKLLVAANARRYKTIRHRLWKMSQTSFGHISINSPSILTVSTATESPWKDLSIGTSHVSRQSIMAEILGRSTGNHYGTVY